MPPTAKVMEPIFLPEVRDTRGKMSNKYSKWAKLPPPFQILEFTRALGKLWELDCSFHNIEKA